MSKNRFLSSFPLIIVALSAHVIRADDSGLRSRLKQEGTQLRLQGDYEGANRIHQTLLDAFPNDAIGYVFNLNTLVTRLSWDEQQTRYDKQIESDANTTLSLCRRATDHNPNDYLGYYYCGQAHFALSYLNAIRGNYYQAGHNANLTIKLLERTLKLKPDLTDARMHLGVAYYYADNLPPYLKALASFIWFIPTGNSEKSLLYLDQVTQDGEHFKDVAKYLYADLLVQEDEEGREQATTLLEQLTRDYPQNRRFHLRLIGLLLARGLYRQALEAGGMFLKGVDIYRYDRMDVSLIKLWITRAQLALHRIDQARQTFREIDDHLATSDLAPSWSASWHLLTRAQLLDLQDRRTEAKRSYAEIVALRKTADVHPAALLAAQAGLETPYNGVEATNH